MSDDKAAEHEEEVDEEERVNYERWRFDVLQIVNCNQQRADSTPTVESDKARFGYR